MFDTLSTDPDSLQNVADREQTGGMCGRFAMDKRTDQLIVDFIAETGRGAEEWTPSWNVAPTQSVPVVREHEGKRTVELVRWGIVSPSSPVFGGGKPIINARIETVASNGLFKGAFTSHRCLVPAKGYYEWKLQETGKQPYFIHSGDTDLAMAGIIRAWKDKTKDDGDRDQWRLSMAIITRDAHAVPGEVHDRMPNLLTPAMYDDWLGDHLGTDELLKVLEASSREVADNLDFYPVSKAVSSPKNDRPELLEPISF
ncbi:SOS response-associated peptidase [Lacisediminihabitans sp. FW035]